MRRKNKTEEKNIILDENVELTEEELKGLYEVYDVYTNEYHKKSYIHDKFEKLREEKKI